jgi:hypothetical protein
MSVAKRLLVSCQITQKNMVKVSYWHITVDGANWRMSAGGASGGNLSYPDFLLSGDEVPNVTGKKSKLWANELMSETW